MFHRILVALDNSETSRAVFEKALEIAGATQAHLMLLHVLTDEEVGYPDQSDLDRQIEQWQNCRQKGSELLRSRQALSEKLGIQTEMTEITGAAPREICDCAETWQADLIVMGHHDLSGIQRFIRGSVSNYVMHYASCSVMTVQI
ncbi:MAG: universal stress protein [Leptolyngbya sp. Prado105]|jgi:nucleotide-binding universal stress UspA family protein|nr:universal stress protein [Leptolyngbya sp. Prado105]